MERAWCWTQFEPINVDNHLWTSYVLHTDERIVTTFNLVHCQAQDFNSVVRMSVYMYLVVVALLVLPTDSFKCVLPDEIEYTMKVYKENDYFNFSICSQSHTMAYTRYSFDKNNKTIISSRTVDDYNVMIGFDILPDGLCTLRKLLKDVISGIPDNADIVDKFPVPWPYEVPDKTEIWRYGWMIGSKIVVAVERIQPNVCIPLAKALVTIQQKLIPKSAAFTIGNYSLIISNKHVFEIPPECLEQNGKSI